MNGFVIIQQNTQRNIKNNWRKLLIFALSVSPSLSGWLMYSFQVTPQIIYSSGSHEFSDFLHNINSTLSICQLSVDCAQATQTHITLIYIIMNFFLNVESPWRKKKQIKRSFYLPCRLALPCIYLPYLWLLLILLYCLFLISSRIIHIVMSILSNYLLTCAI